MTSQARSTPSAEVPSSPPGSIAEYPPYGPPISMALARTIVYGAIQEAHRFGWRMAVVVAEPTGELVLLAKDDDTQYGSTDLAIQKARTAARTRRSTEVFEDLVRQKGATHLLSADGIIALAGGLPIVIDGRTVGGFGVSGELASEDAQIAAAGLEALAERLRKEALGD